MTCSPLAVRGSPAPATEWPFRGYVSKFQPGQIVGEDIITFTAEIQPTEAYDADLP